MVQNATPVQTSGHPGYPRPQLERAHWQPLDGPWEFTFTGEYGPQTPGEVVYDRQITVPYAPESEASGVHDTGFHHTLWYRRSVVPDGFQEGKRLYLHFGAVDYAATIWVNGQMVVQHEGGHTPFCAEIGALCRPGEAAEIVVRATDDPHDLAKPRGKQDWEAEPHEIWYPRTSGIWQTVWLEVCPEAHLDSLVWTPNVERWELELRARVVGPLEGLRLRVKLEAASTALAANTVLADDTYTLAQADLWRTVSLPDPGIDNARSHLLWSPEHPQLITATLELLRGDEVIDRVSSYAAMRSVAVDEQHFLLNGRPYPLKLVLDQGYWPKSLMSASDDELRRDVELTRLLGFNGARKHQKIEDPRYLYWCDVLGLLVWEELPSAYSFTTQSVLRLTREWSEAIERDRSHPCIVAWVPINESWGVPDLPLVAAQRDLVRALYHLTKALDPTRPVIGNDGWEHVVGDIAAIHDYSHKPAVLLERYGTTEALSQTLSQLRPHKRLLSMGESLLGGGADRRRPAMLTEFGGIAYTVGPEQGWGYTRSSDAQGLQDEYTRLLAAVHACEGLSGFCYTQLTDTFQEKNGLLFEDRMPKTSIAALALANRGERSAQEQERDADQGEMGYDRQWRARLRQKTRTTGD